MKSAASTKKPTRYKPVDKIDVYLWGQNIGSVVMDPLYGFYVFAYSASFRLTGIEPAPLHMPVSGMEETFIFTDLPEATYKRLPALLGDALPDDFGNALIDSWMAVRGIPKADISGLDRLAYMGARAMGALQFKPSRGGQPQKSTALVLSALVDEARNAVRGLLGTDNETNAALRSIIDVGTSAGGARAKAVIAWNPQTDEILAGQFDAPAGFGYWLLKFDGMGLDSELGTSQDYGRIEYAYYLMARAAGIKMTQCRLLQENGRAHFMTERFDRAPDGQRHHMQTLCAMAHLDYKKKGTNSYAQLFIAVMKLELPYEDKEEVFRRMAFNVMARNCDDHTKNISFRLRQGQAWELAPAYDITFAHNPKGEWTHQHLMSVNGKFHGFIEEDLIAESDRFGIGTAKQVLAEVRTALQGWSEFANQAGVSADQSQSIKEQFLLLKPA